MSHDSCVVSLSFSDRISWIHCLILRFILKRITSSASRQRDEVGPTPQTADHGGVAHLGEHLPCKQGVRGSIPLISTTVP